MPQINFTISADASQLLRAEDQIIAKQKEVERGFTKMAGTAENAHLRASAAAQKAAETYDLAEPGAAGSGAVRFAGSTGRASRRPIYGLAAPRASAGAAATVAGYTGEAIELRSEFQSRLRSGNIDRLLQRSQTISARAAERVEADRQKRLGRASAEGEIAVAQFEAKSPLNPDNIEKQKAAAKRRSAVARDVGAAAAMAGYGVNELAEQYEQRMQHLGDATKGFEDQMRGLIGIGGNVNIAGKLKSDVLSKSVAFGMDRGEVATSSYDLQSIASNLPGNVQAQLMGSAAMMTKVKGGSMDTTMKALVKTYQNFGGNFNSVGDMANALSSIEENASVDITELSDNLIDILPALKLVGGSFSEGGAALEVMTQRLGKNEKTFTAWRNIMLSLPEAEKQGIHLTGSLTDRLEQLHTAMKGMNNDQATQFLTKLFGERNATAGAALLGNLDQMRSGTARLAAGPAPGMSLDEKYAQRFGDAGFRTTDELKSLDVLKGNVDVIKGQDPKMQQAMTNYQATQAGAALGADAGTPEWLTNLRGRAGYWLNGMAGGAIPDSLNFGKDYERVGVDEVAKAARASGDKTKEYVTRISHGDVQGLTYDAPKTMEDIRNDQNTATPYMRGPEASRYKKVSTSAKDVGEYVDLLKDYDLSDVEFASYKSMKNRGQDTKDFLNTHRRGKKPFGGEISPIAGKAFLNAVTGRRGGAGGGSTQQQLGAAAELLVQAGQAMSAALGAGQINRDLDNNSEN